MRREVKETTVRYSRAKEDLDRIGAAITRIETRLVGVDQQQAALRSMATRGAAALYMHDSTAEWADGFGDGGEQVLEAARRARLIGDMNELAGAAVRNLDDATKQIDEDRRRLREKRKDQEAALARLGGERRLAVGRFSAAEAVEKDEARQRLAAETEQREAAAEERRVPRASRGLDGAVLDAAATPGFICPMAGPFETGDGWGSGRGHQGADLLAPRGSEQLAVVSGKIETKFWGGGGLTLFLFGEDGHTYVYMHLLRVVGDRGRHVEQGEVIGLTGSSGQASASHLHFEFHPKGGGAVNPRPLLARACPSLGRNR